ncbi:MAG TPA: DUF697 domain-containing protein [Gaiellales bacterium]|nr:DUF697 domain-containing protein [Gaiellales bacterium]
MPSGSGGALGSAKMVVGSVRDVGRRTDEHRPMLLCGRKEPLEGLIEAMGAEHAPGVQLFAVRRLQEGDAARLSTASVVVYGGEVVSGLDEQTRGDLEVVGRASAPKLAMLEALDLPSAAVSEAGRVRGMQPSDLMPYRQGKFPVQRAMRRLSRRVGGSGPWLASQLPAFRPYVVDELIEAAAKRNAKAALLIFVPGADMPVLTAVQMRLVLAIAACYGQKISTDRAIELLSVLGAGFGFRAIAREMLDFVPFAGWAVQSGVAYSGTKALGKAADEYFAHGAIADASRVRAFAEGLRYEVEARLKRR